MSSDGPRGRAPRALVAAALLAAACGGPAPPSNLLLVSVDTLRADHLSLYGYERSTTPRIDAFFADGEIYERAYSTEANTTPSVVSLLTGLYPPRHRVRLLLQPIGDDLVTLADRLESEGFQTAAVVSNAVLTSEATGLDARFDHYDDFVDEREPGRNVYERRASRTTDAALRWLEDERDPGRRHFLWVHYIDPHGPYRAPDGGPADFRHEGTRPLELRRVLKYQWLPGVTDALEYVDRYDEEIAYADHEIGRLLERYAELVDPDDAVVVFTADHGETMLEHERHFTHGYHVWEPIMRVPLAVRRPGAAPARVSHPVSLVDVVPSVLAYLGLPAPRGLDGLRLSQRPPESEIHLEARGSDGPQQRALVVGTRKYYASDDGGRITRGWFVDLAEDPTERGRTPWPARDAEVRSLIEWASEDPDPGGIPTDLRRGILPSAPKVAPGATPEQLEQLRALGYAE